MLSSIQFCIEIGVFVKKFSKIWLGSPWRYLHYFVKYSLVDDRHLAASKLTFMTDKSLKLKSIDQITT